MPEYPANRPSEMEPAHPGAILRNDVLPALELSVAAAATQLGVAPSTLRSLLNERSRVSPEMAVGLGRFCGNGAVFWSRMQAAHDVWHAERELRGEVSKIHERPSH